MRNSIKGAVEAQGRYGTTETRKCLRYMLMQSSEIITKLGRLLLPWHHLPCADSQQLAIKSKLIFSQQFYVSKSVEGVLPGNLQLLWRAFSEVRSTKRGGECELLLALFKSKLVNYSSLNLTQAGK